MKLFFDIETIPDQSTGALDRYLKEVQPPGNYKKQESIQKWIDENAEAVAVDNWRKSALDGIAGEIVSIAWAFDDRAPEGVCRTLSEDEGDVIRSFYSAIQREIRRSEGKFPRLQWIGHNIIEFDLRFLFQRSVILNVRPPVEIPHDERHGNSRVYDTMRGWAGFRGYVKQDAIIEALDIGLDAPEGIMEIDGSKVWDLVQTGQLETLLDYNKLDVERCRALWRRMKWKT